MLPIDMAKNKSKTQRQVKLIKNIAATLYNAVDAFNMPSLPNEDPEILPDSDEKVAKEGVLFDGAEPGAYDSMSTQLSLAKSVSSISNISVEDNGSMTDKNQVETVSENNFVRQFDQDNMEERMKRYRRKSSGSDMRETSWDIPKHSTAVWYSYSSESDLDSIDFFNLQNKKSSSRLQEDGDVFDENDDPSAFNRFSQQLQIRDDLITEFCEQNHTAYTDCNESKCKRCKKTKANKSPKKLPSANPKHYSRKTVENSDQKDAFNHVEERPEKSKIHKKTSKNKAEHGYRLVDRENNFTTTIIRRPHCRNLVDSNQEAWQQKDDFRGSNTRLSETDTNDSNTIGYVVNKPVAKLCLCAKTAKISNHMRSQHQSKALKSQKLHYSPHNSSQDEWQYPIMPPAYAHVTKPHARYHKATASQPRCTLASDNYHGRSFDRDMEGDNAGKIRKSYAKSRINKTKPSRKCENQLQSFTDEESEGDNTTKINYKSKRDRKSKMAPDALLESFPDEESDDDCVILKPGRQKHAPETVKKARDFDAESTDYTAIDKALFDINQHLRKDVTKNAKQKIEKTPAVRK